MKIIGFRYLGADPPLTDGFVPLDETTTILGPNDSGKSILLSTIVMAGRPSRGFATQIAHPVTSDGSHPRMTTVYLECDDGEANDLIWLATRDLVAIDHLPYDLTRQKWLDKLWGGTYERVPGNVRRLIGPGKGWDFEALDSSDLAPGANALSDWHTTLSQHCAPEAFEGDQTSVLSALKKSRVFALTYHSGLSTTESLRLAVHWCLTAEQSAHVEFAGSIEGEQPTVVGSSSPEAALLRFEREPGEPMIAAPVGAVPDAALPRVMPLPFAGPSSELIDAVFEIITPVISVREGKSASRNDYPWCERIDTGATAELSGIAIRESAISVVNEVELRANSILDDVKRLIPYELRFELEIGESGLSRRVRLAPRGRSPELRFEIDEVASGFRMWIQYCLVLLHDELATYVRTMRCLELVTEKDDEGLFLDPSRADSKVWSEFERFFECHLDGTLDGVLGGPYPRLPDDYREMIMDWIVEEAKYSAELGGLEEYLEYVAVRAPRLFVIDEPEQNLHPRAQRRIVAAVRDWQRRNFAQTVVASHSATFLRVSRFQEYVRMIREDCGPSHPVRIPRETLRRRAQAITNGDIDEAPVDAMFEEIGFDRGELLSLINVVLWVEGEHDRIVLEALFEDELWEHGILVSPLRGTGRSSGIHVAKLRVVPGAKQVVFFDNISEDGAQRLNTAISNQRWEPDEGAPEEYKDALKIGLEAHEVGCQVHIDGHEAFDIIAALDPECVNAVVAQRHGTTYDHLQTISELERRTEAGEVKGSERKKAFIRDKMRLGNSDQMTLVIKDAAQLMAENGIRPQALTELIAWCERLSIEA